ncbi:MAG: HAD family hydrolase [Parcubacteria group bacterium]|nr:HAD family hydrolase [Parcubacteria group bacterium]
MKVKLLICDVNGTLFDDTEKQFLNSINGIFVRFEKSLFSLKDLREKFCQPWTKIYRDVGITEEMATNAQLYELYNKFYSEQEMPQPFSDVFPTLLWLKNKKIVLGVISTQQNIITERLLHTHELKQFFTYHAGGVSNKAEAITLLIKKLSLDPKQVAYIGDQEQDVTHAQQAKCVSIAYARGVHSLSRLLNTKPDFTLCNFSELTMLSIF